MRSNPTLVPEEGGEPAATVAVGAEPGENATLRAAEHHVLVAKEMFNSPVKKPFKWHPSPTVKGLERVL